MRFKYSQIRKPTSLIFIKTMNYYNINSSIPRIVPTKPDPKSRQIKVNIMNPSEAKYYRDKKYNESEMNSPFSSDSINTPIKYSSAIRPPSKEPNKLPPNNNYKSSSINMYKPNEPSNLSKSIYSQPVSIGNSYKIEERTEFNKSNYANPYPNSKIDNNFSSPNYSKPENKGIINGIPLEKSISSIGGYSYNPNNNGNNAPDKKNLEFNEAKVNNYSKILPEEKDKVSNLVSKQSKKKRGMAGLRNIGNTCFLYFFFY